MHCYKLFLTISGILRIPVENTMAFGGVATGNIKANEQATAEDTIRYKGFSPKVRACNIDIKVEQYIVLIF